MSSQRTLLGLVLGLTAACAATAQAQGMTRWRVTESGDYRGLQAERPLWENTSLSLEWRGRWAKDSVALYRYQAQTVSATLALRF